jgi:hypothetical protein
LDADPNTQITRGSGTTNAKVWNPPLSSSGHLVLLAGGSPVLRLHHAAVPAQAVAQLVLHHLLYNRKLVHFTVHLTIDESS